jgi:hypothetical protein
MPGVGFEPMILTFELAKTLDRAATVTGKTLQLTIDH